MAGTIQKTILLFSSAFDGLGVEVPMALQERLAIMVNEAMSSQARSFHTPAHVFALADTEYPIITLAALFHDLVYYQIDKGFTPEIEKLVKKYIKTAGQDIQISENIANDDLLFETTLQIFGFKRGQKLSPFSGMNEFLSALVMNVSLKDYVELFHLVKATACVEATIPFRGKTNDGKTAAEALADRIFAMNSEFAYGLSTKEIDEITQCAVTFANRDVMNFAETNVGVFLDNTWKLLPETNPALRTTGIFTIANYLTALRKMEQFMRFLNPDNIFAYYKKVPNRKTLSELQKRAHKNVKAGRDYLGIKMLASSILNAVASISGGDAPISLFMGDISRTDDDIRFEDLLPEADMNGEITNTIHGLLAVGRASESNFDLRNSPLANYVFSTLGQDICKKRIEDARAMFENKLSAREFLDKFPDDMISPLLGAFAEMAFTREDKIYAYLESRKIDE